MHPPIQLCLNYREDVSLHSNSVALPRTAPGVDHQTQKFSRQSSDSFSLQRVLIQCTSSARPQRSQDLQDLLHAAFNSCRWQQQGNEPPALAEVGSAAATEHIGRSASSAALHVEPVLPPRLTSVPEASNFTNDYLADLCAVRATTWRSLKALHPTMIPTLPVNQHLVNWDCITVKYMDLCFPGCSSKL